MKGTIHMPARFEHDFVCDRYNHLLEGLASCLDWKLIYTDNLNHDDIYGNVLLSLKTPQGGGDIIHGNHTNWQALASLPEEIKLITYYSDLHMVRPELESIYKQAMMGVLGRSNLILTAYWHPFCQQYPYFVHKTIHFPQFFSPTDRYNFTPNPQAMLKCLTCGVYDDLYDLRRFLVEYEHENNTGLISYLPHPGYEGNVKTTSKYKVKDDYAQELHKYFCGFADCTNMQYVVGKYIEIPAAGSLLLARYAKDLELLGFKHKVNYIKVNSKTMIEYIYDILNHPGKYEHIRKAGHALVHSKFGLSNRLAQLKAIIHNITSA